MRLRRSISSLVAAGIIILGGSRRVLGQSSTSLSTSIVTANFSVLDRPSRFGQTPTTCESVFERTSRTIAFDSAAGHENEHVARAVEDDKWMPLPMAAVQSAQACIHRLPDVEHTPAGALPTLLRLAIGVNDDSLVRAIVARQLDAAGPGAQSRAAVLDSVITQLMTNSWISSDREIVHLTRAHVELARQYAAQIDALGPAVLQYRLHVMDLLDRASRRDETDVDAQLANTKTRLQQLRQLLAKAMSPHDQQSLKFRIFSEEMDLAHLIYMKTLSHADLTRWVTMRRSVGFAMPSDSLVGKPATRIQGDYWFSIPAGTQVSAIPALGRVSLVVFIPENLWAMSLPTSEFAELRRLHEQFPALQIILVSLTQGFIQGRALFTHPEQEAELLHQYFTDSLNLPGTLCVIKGRYHTVDGGHVIPIANPIFDAYYLDPRPDRYAGREFLVDAQGWVVRTLGIQSAQDEELIRRLLAQAAIHSDAAVLARHNKQ